MKIIKEDPYRSNPLVNMSYDMVRVVMDCTRHEWREIKKKLEPESEYEKVYRDLMENGSDTVITGQK
jgi:hypothetical protein